MESTPHGRGEAPWYALPGQAAAGLAIERFLELVPSAILVTRGPDHVLVSVNAAGRQLLASHGNPVPGHPLREAIPESGTGTLVALLDQAFRTGIILRDRDVPPLAVGTSRWCCSIWPQAAEGDELAHLVTELRVTPEPDPALVLQRLVTERMLLGALSAHDRAASAESSRERAVALAAQGERLGASLDRATTEYAVAHSALPYPGAWCVVDLIDDDGRAQRLGVVHPDPLKQALARELDGRWPPGDGDMFGAPAMQRAAKPLVAMGGLDALRAPAAGREGDDARAVTRRVLAELGGGALLTVPMHMGGRLAGALTFVSGERDRTYTPEDIALAEALAVRNALALERAREHADVITGRQRAEAASRAKSAFIAHMSHELRTPLSAMTGYVDLIDMGLRGPVTDQQHADLARIRLSQQHLASLITNVLNYVREDEGRTQFHLSRVGPGDAFAIVVDMLDPLIRSKGLVLTVAPSEAGVAAHADVEKLTQILVNLVGNAVKFTPARGRLSLRAEASAHTVLFHIADSGIGIAPEVRAAIFEPFVQVRGTQVVPENGMGLGLAISRSLARGMGGDLSVESVPGEGSTFTLSLPRAT